MMYLPLKQEELFILALVVAPSQEQLVSTRVTALAITLAMNSAAQVVRAQVACQDHAVVAVTLLGVTNQEAVVARQGPQETCPPVHVIAITKVDEVTFALVAPVVMDVGTTGLFYLLMSLQVVVMVPLLAVL